MQNVIVKKRNPFAVWIMLPLITIGFYHFFWIYFICTELEGLNNKFIKDQDKSYKINDLFAPGVMWLLWVFIPFGAYFVVYKYSELIKNIAKDNNVPIQINPFLNCCLLLLFNYGIANLQNQLNIIYVYLGKQISSKTYEL